jgi:folate-binding protein YgfZ
MTPPPLIPSTPCAVLRASGPDAFRFLNGQLTNDMVLATPETTLPAAALNAKGGLEAVCWVRKVGDDFLLDAPLALRETLMARLDRYLIADDLTLTDESDDWTLAHLLTEELSVDLPDCFVTRSSRFGVPGLDLLSRKAVTLPDTRILSPEESETHRIAKGIPAWGKELTTGLLPPEAGLEATAISYEKGCYLGQEVISRMKWAGKTNRHLVQLELSENTAVPREFFHDGVAAGVVTSISPSVESPSVLALGFRRRKFENVAEFSLGESGGACQVRILTRLAGAKTLP